MTEFFCSVDCPGKNIMTDCKKTKDVCIDKQRLWYRGPEQSIDETSDVRDGGFFYAVCVSTKPVF